MRFDLSVASDWKFFEERGNIIIETASFPPIKSDVHLTFSRAFSSDHRFRFVVWCGHRPVGSILLFNITGKGLEAYVSLHKDFRGRGIGSWALDAVCGLTSSPIFALVNKKNLASYKMCRKAGFSILSEDSSYWWLVRTS